MTVYGEGTNEIEKYEAGQWRTGKVWVGGIRTVEVETRLSWTAENRARLSRAAGYMTRQGKER